MVRAGGKEIHVVHDICYHPFGPSVASSAQYLDVYMPPEADRTSSLPVVVFLHGGGWRRGTRRSKIFHFFQNVGLALADLGFVAVLPSYRKSLPYAPWLLGMMISTATMGMTALVISILGARSNVSVETSRRPIAFIFAAWSGLSLAFRQLIRWVCPGVRHPAHLEDCAMAVEWVCAGGTRVFGGDPKKVILLGNSAGAHLASMLVLESSKPSPTKSPTSPSSKSALKGLIAISGVYSGPRFYKNWFTRHMFGYVFDDHRNWDACFPLGCCPDPSEGEGRAQPLRDLCPVLLINAAFDVGLQAHADDFAQRLRQCGAQVSGPVIIPGTDHFRMLPMLGRHQRGKTRSREDRELLPLIADFVKRVCE